MVSRKALLSRSSKAWFVSLSSSSAGSSSSWKTCMRDIKTLEVELEIPKKVINTDQRILLHLTFQNSARHQSNVYCTAQNSGVQRIDTNSSLHFPASIETIPLLTSLFLSIYQNQPPNFPLCTLHISIYSSKLLGWGVGHDKYFVLQMKYIEYGGDFDQTLHYKNRNILSEIPMNSRRNLMNIWIWTYFCTNSSVNYETKIQSGMIDQSFDLRDVVRVLEAVYSFTEHIM